MFNLHVSPYFWPTVRLLPLDLTGDITDYEFLLSVVTQLNKLTEQGNLTGDMLMALKADVETLQQQMENIYNGDFSFLAGIIKNALKNVWFGISQAGYFVAYIPDSWEEIGFATTGYDIAVDGYDYGHLVCLNNEVPQIVLGNEELCNQLKACFSGD